MSGVQVGSGFDQEKAEREQLRKDRDWYRDKCQYLEEKLKQALDNLAKLDKNKK